MGPGDQATPTAVKTAYDLGKAIAQAGWAVLTGGRQVGVMDAASRGAKAVGGLTIGILPTDHPGQMSDAVDIPVLTGLGHGRNVINILTSHVVIACGSGPGTASEIALALKTGKPLIFIEIDENALAYWQSLSEMPLQVADTAEQAIEMVKAHLP